MTVVVNTPVRDLDAAASVTGTEKIYADDGSNDVYITPAQIKTYAISGKQDADDDLTALAALESTGILVRTGAGTASTVTVQKSGSGLAVTNGDGVAGSPTIALANDVAAIEALTGAGFPERTGTDTWVNTGFTGTGTVARSASPTLTGTPAAPTASYNTNTTQIATMAALYAWMHRPVSTKTANYTFALGDEQNTVLMNSASALNLTVPADASVAFPNGTLLLAVQHGAGTVTLVADTGVTLESDNSVLTTRQNHLVVLWKRGSNVWKVYGVDVLSLKADKSNVIQLAASISALSDLTDRTVPAYLTEAGREGIFKWSSSNNSSNVTNDPGNGIYVAPSAGTGLSTTGSDGAWVRVLDTSGVVNPRWFGVTFDGATIDNTAWDNLITSINANLIKTVICPTGNTIVNATLNAITASEWEITAAEEGLAQFIMDAAAGDNGTFIIVGNGSTTSSRWRLAGLRFNCNNTASLTSAGGNAILLRNSADGLIDTCYTQDVVGHLTLGNTSLGTWAARTKVSRCKFVSYAPAGGIGIHAISWTGFFMTQTNMSGQGGAAPSTFRGMKIVPTATDQCDTIQMSDCPFNYGGADPLYNIEVDCTNNQVGTLMFSNCIFDQAVSGANFYVHCDSGAAAAAWTTIIMNGCTSNASTSANCVYINNTGAKQISFKASNCTFSQAGGAEPMVEIAGGNAVDVQLTGNSFVSRSTSTTPECCIQIGSGVSGVTAVGNTITELSQVTTGTLFVQPNYFVKFTGSASNCIVANNNCAKAQIADCYTNSITAGNNPSLIIRNNVCKRQTPGNVTQTTNATVTSASLIVLEDETTYHIRATVIAVRDTGAARACYVLEGTFYRTGGGAATLEGAVTVVHRVESVGAWDAIMDTGGNNARVRVTGELGVTINWTVRLEVIALKSAP